jgi:alkaline phosphatase
LLKLIKRNEEKWDYSYLVRNKKSLKIIRVNKKKKINGLLRQEELRKKLERNRNSNAKLY